MAGQDAVHQALAGVANVTHPESHAGKLEQAKWHGDDCLGDVLWVLGVLLVPLSQV